jgi:hypothetical protein
VTPCPHFDALLVEGSCYWDLKQKAMNGARAKLSEEQLEFCGFGSPRTPERGWRPAWTILPAFNGTEDDSDPEERRGVLYTMRRGRERAELSV